MKTGDSAPSPAVWDACFAAAARIPISRIEDAATLAAIEAAIREAEPAAEAIEVGTGACMPVWAHYHVPGDRYQKVVWLEPGDFKRA